MKSRQAKTLQSPVPALGRLGMMASTLYRQSRFALRFDAYRKALMPAPALEAAVQGFIRSLPVSQQGMAKSSLKRHLGRTALDWGAIETVRYFRNEPNLAASVLQEPQRAQVKEAAHGPRELAIIECLYTARRAEVAALSWCDVDLGRGVLTIRRGKGGRPDVTLLTEGAQSALAAWFLKAGEPSDVAPVFPRPCGNAHARAGGHYSPGGMGKLVVRILARAGCWKPGSGGAHRMRRTFATEFLRANEKDLVGLQRLLRHSQISTTQKYIYFDPTDLSDRLGRVRL